MLGWALAGLGLLLALFAALAAVRSEPWLPFLLSGLLAGVPGGLLLLGGRAHSEPSRQTALLSILLIWLLVPAVGGLPYLLGGQLGVLDALFEAMSGFTTTGASVQPDQRSVPDSLLLYKSLTQCLGVIGIIIVFVAVFPQLGVAGRHLLVGDEPGLLYDWLSPRLRFASAAQLSI